MKTLSQYLVAAVLSLILFVLVTHAWHLNIAIPFFYSWDSVFSGVFIKTVQETGWYITNPYIGAPNGFNLADFPLGADNANFLIIKLLTLFIHHYAVIWNIYYILTFPLVTLAALMVLQRLGLHYPFALTGSLLFALLPYHFLHAAAGHLFLTVYFIVPLIIWLAVLIATDKFALKNFRYPRLQGVIYVLLCILIGSTGIYYTLFGLFFILTAGIIGSLNQYKLAPFFQALILTGLISSTLAINFIPTIVYQMRYGVNQTVVNRAPFEAELYGLKVTQMLLPVDNDRVPIMAALKNKYNSSAPLINQENTAATLGIIGSIGFLLLLGIAILGVSVTQEIRILSQLNLCAVLLTTIGGFGSLFSYTISSVIRCYSRISIFIAFFSLCACFFFLQKITQKYPVFTNKILTWLLAIGVLVTGVFNQTGRDFSNLGNRNPTFVANFNNDEKFIQAIEKIMPPGSMIYQLPYVPFPENPPVFAMADYEHFRAYLHSQHLKWSYGAIKGRPLSQWQEQLSALPTEQMLDQLSYAGYSGIYIDRNGYADHGVAIEKHIAALLNEKPLISADKHLSFFDIRHYVEQLKESESADVWNDNVMQMQRQTALSIGWNQGFYSLETSGTKKWHWSNKKASLNIVNYTKQSIPIKISFIAATGDASFSNLIIKSSLFTKLLKINNKGVVFSDSIIVPPGLHKLFFYSDAQQVNAPGDPRQLYFRIEDFKYEI